MTTLQQARTHAHDLGNSHRTPAQRLPIAATMGATLAAPVIARTAVPASAVSAMDGWVTAGPGPWRIDGQVRMGEAPRTPLMSGTARAVTTGGALPAGAAAVLRFERSRMADGQLFATVTLEPGTDVRPAGEELALGEVIAAAGTTVTPGVVAAAAVGGVDDLDVRRPPRARVIIIGDEIIQHGIPAPGQVRDAFEIPVPAMLAARGISVVEVLHAGDDLNSVREALMRSDTDLIVTTGGTGRGDADYLAPAIAACGGTLEMRGVDVRPGHPTVLAEVADVPVLGLPGNPFAALGTLVAIGYPLIAGLLGAPLPLPQCRIAAQDLEGSRSATRLLAVKDTDRGLITVGRQGAAMACVLAEAEALALIEPAGVPAGQQVKVLPLPWTG
ncbi:molybdopterin molybdotransferase MoeA [Curtobacterium sp. MCSS17_005]|uniref:molybdopterin molybdotransferase MoeA n=1 Tax=Curtobacterium sp. MCSS17_005 TaxID=2175641 RepID=UPI000DA81C7C|nr:molybdopterin molybdotransferase MoeA [Curtobacterium sp. MCSS17_005]WIB34330.1 molybdopterin molybdotransferase MoeA [Curtobacterium sp. MCSS17_005]